MTRAGEAWPTAGMANVLSEEKKQQVVALGKLGWTLRRIEEETGVRRETASGYLKAAGIPVRPPRNWGRLPASNPANEASTDPGAGANPAKDPSPDPEAGPNPAKEVSTDPTWPVRPGPAPQASACEPYREMVERAIASGRNAKAIWQDLVDDHGFTARYASVKRFVARLKAATSPEAHPVIETAPGEEGQVDYGDGPMVRYPETGKYRRTRLFVMTLGYSRKSVRFIVWKSSTRIWAELHERAFRRLGGVPKVIVLDNLKEGVIDAEIHDPVLNHVYQDLVAHYGVVALPCRVGAPDRQVTRVYIVCFTTGELLVVDPDLGIVLDTIQVGGGANDLALNFGGNVHSEPLHRRAYVTNYTDMTISAVDLDRGSPTEDRVIARIGLTTPPPAK